MPPSSQNKSASRNLLIVSFSFVITLMTLIIIISVSEFKNTSVQLHEIVNVNNYKQKLVEEMHISAFKRVSSLQRMILLDDPFDQDDEAMFIDDQGGVFSKARHDLLKTRLNDKEITLLEEQAQYARITVPTIRRIVNLIREENIEQAQHLLKNELIPAQQIIFNDLSDLQKIQEENINQAFNSILLSQDFSRYYMLALGMIAAILSMIIALLTYKRVHLAEKLLSQEKERAQITLQNIVDGVITTDEQGLIDFINPTASALTGWYPGHAIGQPLLKVLDLTDTKQRQVCSSIDKFIHCDKDELILLSRDGERIAIEHSTSMLPSAVSTNQGVVVTFRNVTEARALTQTLSYQATHDPLTDLYNRKAFEDHLSKRISDSRNKDQTHILCFLDLDHFKQVNDTAGHVAGDELLIQVTRIFLKQVRNSDFLARIGGDEFAIVLENCDIEKALDITEDIRSEIHDYEFYWMDKLYQITVSIGIAVLDKNIYDITQVLEQADQACYLAKESGKNLIKVFVEDKKNKKEDQASRSGIS